MYMYGRSITVIEFLCRKSESYFKKNNNIHKKDSTYIIIYRYNVINVSSIILQSVEYECIFIA